MLEEEEIMEEYTGLRTTQDFRPSRKSSPNREETKKREASALLKKEDQRLLRK